MEFRLLGSIGVARGGVEEAPPGGRMQRTFFAALVLRRGNVVPDAEMNGYLWGTKPPPTGGAQIHTYASRTRKWLGPRADVVRRGHGYLLTGPEWRSDLADFDRLRRLGDEAAHTGWGATAAEYYGRALALWRGPALADATEHLIDAEAAALEESRLSVLLKRIETEIQIGRAGQLVPELRRLVAAHPLHEGMRGLLMSALYQSNRQAEALGEYYKLRLVLRDELGVSPCTNISSLFQQILVGAVPGRAGAQPVPEGAAP